MKNIIQVSLFLIIFFPMAASPADTSRRSPSDDGAFTAGPYYNFVTQSYFELVRVSPKTWAEAQYEASLYSHNGTSGRLAVISRPETHMFIVRNFVFNENTWIGLEYDCETTTLTWNNGIAIARNDFSNWDPEARTLVTMCENEEKLRTFINGGAFDWSLSTSSTFANLILIEYPTGGR